LDFFPCKFDNGFQPRARTGNPDIPANYIKYDGLNLGKQGCIEFWYQPNWVEASHVVTIFEYGQPGTMAIAMGYNDWQGRGGATIYDAASQTTATVYFYPWMIPCWSTTEPFHVAISWDTENPDPLLRSKLRLFFNGVESGSVDTGSSDLQPVTWPDAFYLGLGTRLTSGDWYRHNWQGSDGVIDNIKIWNFFKTDFSDINQPGLVLHHFKIERSGSGVVGMPATLTVSARDVNDCIIPNYAGTIQLSSIPQSPTLSYANRTGQGLFANIPGIPGVATYTFSPSDHGLVGFTVSDSAPETINLDVFENGIHDDNSDEDFVFHFPYLTYTLSAKTLLVKTEECIILRVKISADALSQEPISGIPVFVSIVKGDGSVTPAGLTTGSDGEIQFSLSSKAIQTTTVEFEINSPITSSPVRDSYLVYNYPLTSSKHQNPASIVQSSSIILKRNTGTSFYSTEIHGSVAATTATYNTSGYSSSVGLSPGSDTSTGDNFLVQALKSWPPTSTIFMWLDVAIKDVPSDFPDAPKGVNGKPIVVRQDPNPWSWVKNMSGNWSTDDGLNFDPFDGCGEQAPPSNAKLKNEGGKGTSGWQKFGRVVAQVLDICYIKPIKVLTKVVKSIVKSIFNPIDFRTGALVFTAVDFQRSNDDFQFIRSYRSQAQQDSALGFGWNFSYNENLTIRSNLVIHLDHEGNLFVFRFTNGRYQSIDDRLIHLDRQENGAFRLTDENQNIHFFSSSGRLTLLSNRFAFFRLEYDNNNLLSRVVDRYDRFLTFSYANRLINSVSNSYAQIYHYRYDSNTNLIRVEGPGGFIAEYEYDENHRMIHRNDPSIGDSFAERGYEYDEFGRVVKEFDAYGREYRFEYDLENLRIGMTDPEGGVFTVSLYSNGAIHSFSDPMQNVETYSYNDFNELMEFGNLNGEVFRFSYDDEGRLSSYKDPLDRIFRIIYDSNGNVKEFRLSDSEPFSFDYDERGNLSEISMTLSGSRDVNFRMKYDEMGNLKSVVDFDNTTAEYRYDFYGRLTSVFFPFNGDTNTSPRQSYAYDDRGRLARSEDSLGRPIQYIWNDANRLAKVIRADQSERSYFYDMVGNLVEYRDGNGNSSLFRFDRMSRMTNYIDAVGRRFRFQYDFFGNIVHADMPDGTQNDFEYDPDGRLIRSTDALGVSSQLEYDHLDNVTEFVNPNGHRYTFAYDSGQNLIRMNAPNGAVLNYSYDAFGRLIRYSDAEGNRYEYAYDELGRFVTEKRPLGDITRHVYDDNANTLTNIDGGGRRESYRFDAVGRPVESYVGRDLVYHYRYDSEGNIVFISNGSLNNRFYSYDALNRLIRVQDQAGYESGFVYDAHGNVIKSYQGAGGTNYFEYDRLNRPAITRNNSGEILEYRYLPNGLVGEIAGSPRSLTRYKYDANGRMIRREDANGRADVLTFDPAGNLQSVTDPSGDSIRYEYDAIGKLRKMAFSGGRVVSYSYNKMGAIVSMTDAEGQYHHRDLDANMRVTRIYFPDLSSISYEYDGSDNVKTMIRPNGGVCRYEFDDFNHRTKMTDPLGNEYRYRYNPIGLLTEETLPNNSSIRYTYGANNAVLKVENPGGCVRKYVYDLSGKVISEEDVNGNRTAYVYDANSRLIETIHPDSTRETKSYDAQGRLVRDSDESGHSTLYEYDVLGRLIARTDPCGNQEKFFYDEIGNLIRSRNRNGDSRYYVYGASRLLASVDEEMKTNRYVYDSAGRVTAVLSPEGRQVRYGFDDRGRLCRVFNPDGTRRSIEYDTMGNVRSVTDENSHVTVYERDLLGRVARIIDAEGGVSSFRYDRMGNIVTNIDANGHRTGMVYDEAGRMVKRIDATGRTAEYGYDCASGKPVRVKKPDGRSKTFSYDSRYRLTGTSDSDGNSASFRYNPDGTLSGLRSGDIVVDYLYDSCRRPVGVNYRSIGKRLSYQYDPEGNLTEINNSAAHSTGYHYYRNGLLRSIRSSTDGEFRFHYDDDNRNDLIEYPNGISVGYSRDDMGRITAIDAYNDHHETMMGLKYGYDGMGNVVMQADDLGSTTYQYDRLNRLIRSTSPFEDRVYSFDPVGNRISLRENRALAETNAYNPLNQLESSLRESEEIRYSYDPNGNLVRMTKNAGGQESVSEFGYDVNDRMISAHFTPSEGRSPMGFRYLPYNENISFGLLGHRFEQSGSGLTNRYLYAPNASLVEQISSRPGGNLEFTAGDELDDYYQANDEIAPWFYLKDQMKSPRYLTDRYGDVFQQYRYGDFGSPENTGKEPNPIRFQGREFDHGTGLYNFRARYYDPESGRFTGEDPFVDEPNPTAERQIDSFRRSSPTVFNLNRYPFVKNNPLAYDDPYGLWVKLTEWPINYPVLGPIASLAGAGHSRLMVGNALLREDIYNNNSGIIYTGHSWKYDNRYYDDYTGDPKCINCKAGQSAENQRWIWELGDINWKIQGLITLNYSAQELQHGEHRYIVTPPRDYTSAYNFDRAVDCLCYYYPTITYDLMTQNCNTFVGRVIRRVGAQFPSDYGQLWLPGVNTK
jgi:RHS repeat-associated protein